jgi:membrane protein
MDDRTRAHTKAERVKLLFTRSVQVWVDKRASSKGAALAFYTLFSIAPILILVLAIAGVLFGPEAARGEIFAQIKQLVGASGAQAIQAVVASTHNSGSNVAATVIASALLFIGATTVFSELKDSLDELWQVPKRPQSGFFNLIRTRVLSFGLILVLAFLLMVSLVLSAALAVLEQYWGGRWHTTGLILQWVSSAITFGAITCLFAVIYKMLPQIRLSWHDVWIGALGTAALFVL